MEFSPSKTTTTTTIPLTLLLILQLLLHIIAISTSRSHGESLSFKSTRFYMCSSENSSSSRESLSPINNKPPTQLSMRPQNLQSAHIRTVAYLELLID